MRSGKCIFFSIDNPYHSTILGGRSPLALFNSLIGVNLCCSKHTRVWRGHREGLSPLFVPDFELVNTPTSLSHTGESKKMRNNESKVASSPSWCPMCGNRNCSRSCNVVVVDGDFDFESFTIEQIFFQLRVACWRRDLFFHKSLFFSREGKWERERQMTRSFALKQDDWNEWEDVCCCCCCCCCCCEGFFSLLKLVAGTDLAILYHDLLLNNPTTN